MQDGGELKEEAELITFEQARQIVEAKLRGEFPPQAGFEVAEWGWENEDDYQLGWSVNDEYRAPSSGPYPIVNKATGAYRARSGAPYQIPNATPPSSFPSVLVALLPERRHDIAAPHRHDQQDDAGRRAEHEGND